MSPYKHTNEVEFYNNEKLNCKQPMPKFDGL